MSGLGCWEENGKAMPGDETGRFPKVLFKDE
jgi:hypothetical protein